MNFLTLEVVQDLNVDANASKSRRSHCGGKGSVGRSPGGGLITIIGGDLNGSLLPFGAAVFVRGDSVHLETRARLDRISYRNSTTTEETSLTPNASDSEVAGFWVLHRTTMRGFPAIICCYFNKRTQTIEERYQKIFYKPGTYACGPRFPKRIFPESDKDLRDHTPEHRQKLKLAA